MKKVFAEKGEDAAVKEMEKIKQIYENGFMKALSENK